MAKKVVIIDYQMSNLFSVQRACEYAGITPLISHKKDDIKNACGVILPGVGAFGDAMKSLEALNIVDAIKDFICSGKSFLGICLGLQLLMSDSDEFGYHKGLDIIKGSVTKFSSRTQEGATIKVPQVGWNQIFSPSDKSDVFDDQTLLKGVGQGEYMYFVHSYYVIPEDKGLVISETNYEGIKYCSSIQRDNIFAVQFHPEKSADQGLEIYKKWASSFSGLSCASVKE